MKELRPLPRTIPKGLNFVICKYISEGKKCGYTGAGPCQYAHCQDELETWKYMCMHQSKLGFFCNRFLDIHCISPVEFSFLFLETDSQEVFAWICKKIDIKKFFIFVEF